MRSKDTLFRLERVSTLLQYLYMDGGNKITFHNGLTDLEIRMDEDLGIACRNLSFPDLPESDFSAQMTPAYIIGVTGILEDAPPVQFPDAFRNRWDEIEHIVKSNLALNRPK